MEITDSFLTLLQSFDPGLHGSDLSNLRGHHHGLDSSPSGTAT